MQMTSAEWILLMVPVNLSGAALWVGTLVHEMTRRHHPWTIRVAVGQNVVLAGGPIALALFGTISGSAAMPSAWFLVLAGVEILHVLAALAVRWMFSQPALTEGDGPLSHLLARPSPEGPRR